MTRTLTREAGSIGTYTATNGEIIITEGGAGLLKARAERDEAERLLLAAYRAYIVESEVGTIELVQEVMSYLAKRGLLEGK